MSHAIKSVGDVGMSRDERSMLLGNTDDGADGGPVQQLLGVLSTMRETAQSVVDGRASRLWADECMNHLILGVEVSLGQGWNDLVDAFTDAGRILQSYENGGKAGQAAIYLVEAYEILCALVTDAMSGTSQPALAAQWRTRYQKEVAALEMAGFVLVTDDYDTTDEADDAFAFPDIKNSGAVRAQDDLPTLDELPPLDSMLSSAPAKSQSFVQKPRVDATPPSARLDAERVARVEEARQQKAAAETASARKQVEEEIETGVQPSTIIVELVDRICEELGGLSRRQMDDRALAVEMIQGGITALKREAAKERHNISADLCDEMLKACTFLAQGHAEIDERFTDLGFAFCGVYVESNTSPTSENVSEWRAECANLIEEWLEAATRPDAPSPAPVAPVKQPEAKAPQKEEPKAPVAAAPVEAPKPVVYEIEEIAEEIIEEETEDAQSAEEDVVWIGSGSDTKDEVIEIVEEVAPPPAPAPVAPKAAAPVVASTPAPVAPVPSRGGLLPSADLFQRAQEALARGDGEAAKGLALQAAAMIAEAEVEKADSLLRGAEAKLKANVTAIEEARSEVKNTEKLVMNSASEVAAGETILGQVKSQTAKVVHDLQESEAEVADLERQIAELHARLSAQQADVANVKAKLEEAKTIEQQSETQLNALRDRERDTRKELEGARQRVKDRQRVSGEIETEMERAREQLSRQRTSLSDIKQTLNRPEPIKTTGPGNEGDTLLF